MTTFSMRLWVWVGVWLSTAVVLAACGGGGSSGDAPVSTSSTPGEAAAMVPASANASSFEMVQYLSVLTTTLPDDRDPLDVSTFAPPTPETTEPEPVIG